MSLYLKYKIQFVGDKINYRFEVKNVGTVNAESVKLVDKTKFVCIKSTYNIALYHRNDENAI